MARTSSEHRENPQITDEEFEQDQSAVIKDFVAIEKVKPIDIKDIERQDEHDSQAAKFNTWFDKFKDLLTSRNGHWEKLLGLIENRGKVTIKCQKEFLNSLDDANCKSIKEQSDTCAMASSMHA